MLKEKFRWYVIENVFTVLLTSYSAGKQNFVDESITLLYLVQFVHWPWSPSKDEAYQFCREALASFSMT